MEVMEDKQRISLKTTLDEIVGDNGWQKEERRNGLSEDIKCLQSRIYNAIWEAGYRHKRLGEFKSFMEKATYGLASLAHIDKKSVDYFNNELKRNGIEPIIPRLSKMDKKSLSHIQHWINYRIYGRDYLKYNGLTKKDIYKTN